MSIPVWRLAPLGACAAAIFLVATPASAIKLFDQNDNALAIDADIKSRSPGSGAEGPDKVVDQVFVAGPPASGSTKYLNFGKEQTGFIVTPAFGSSTVQSLQLRAANDSASRDPMTYELYGTNDAITSGNNSLGNGEMWSLISSGATGLDPDPTRHTAGSFVDFTPDMGYTSYKVVFPTIRDTAAGDADSMQVADVQLFTGAGGAGSAVLATGDPVLAITHNVNGSFSRTPGSGNEDPKFALDDVSANSKYLNFDNVNSGMIVSRADGLPTIVQNITFGTGGDAPERDPFTFDLYGTDDPITSPNNSRGSLENWTLITAGASTGLEPLSTNDALGRNVLGLSQSVANSTAYGAYKIVFPTLRGPGLGIMQVGTITFDGTVVPEPSSVALCGLLLTAVVVGYRRRS